MSHPASVRLVMDEMFSPAVAAALRDLGHDVEKLGDGRELLEQLLAAPPDFVFNIAEGQGIARSREARVPAVLEMLGIPYTGSDPLTLAVTPLSITSRRWRRSVTGGSDWPATPCSKRFQS